MQVHSCCFVNHKPIAFFRSRCCPHRRCLSSILLILRSTAREKLQKEDFNLSSVIAGGFFFLVALLRQGTLT